MDVTVQVGSTKAIKGVSLVALSFVSAQREQVCLLLEIDAAPAEAKTAERECATVLEHALLETEGDAAERLDGTLKELNGLLKGLILSKAIDSVHAIVAIADGHGTLHTSHAGCAEAYIIRGGTAGQITEYTRGKPVPAFVHIASGTLEARDIVVFSTQRLLRAVTPAQLAQMAQRGEQLIDDLVVTLESEKEHAALGAFHVSGPRQMRMNENGNRASIRAAASRRDRRGRGAFVSALLGRARTGVGLFFTSHIVVDTWGRIRDWVSGIFADLKHPQRKRRAHLLLLAGTLCVFVIVWALVNLSASTERGKTRAELKQLMEQIDVEIKKADNQQLAGDVDAANHILQTAEDEAKQVVNNESGLYRTEALDLLDRIRAKREEINHVVRLSPRLVVNASAKNPNILLQGMVGLADGEFALYDKQNLYRVLLNAIDEPSRVTDAELIADGTSFERLQTEVFQTTAGNVIEVINGQPTSMKTEDPSGWISGKDIKTYLRFLYILSPENNQIYKYERLSNRYSAPAEYNINGQIENAVDMAVDGSIFVLKKGGEVFKLFRGEVQPFAIRHAPEQDILSTATKVFKVSGSNLYFLDPVASRVVVVTEGGATGESSYKTQYVLEGDQVGELKDLFVDADEARLYVLDEKRLHVIDLQK
ncbi:MAG: hypothetical protein PHS73_01370 [Candidatus Peribacteraceae bacterium]|nr:hypothetical protein [Candidatus Peribacteraceae bacterium]